MREGWVGGWGREAWWGWEGWEKEVYLWVNEGSLTLKSYRMTLFLRPFLKFNR